jgi:hypothetical protein
MAKICNNCACYEVCFMANPCRTEDCNYAWSPIVVSCKNCQKAEPCDVDGRIWCGRMCRYMKEDGFCSYGERKDND